MPDYGMNTGRKIVMIAMLVGGLLCLAAAGTIWLLSSAHGHGLASSDRTIIMVLSAIGIMDLLLAGLLLLLSRRC